MLLFLLLLISIPSEMIGIYCGYSKESFIWSLDNFNYDEFEMKISDYPSYDYKDDNIDMCRVELFVDYNSRLLIISFADSFEWSQLDSGEGRLDFLVQFNSTNNSTQFYNVLEYACYHQDHCNQLFVLMNIHWLEQVNYTIFQTHLRSLLFNNSNQIENCYTDKINSFKCLTGICSGKYSKHYKTYLFECNEDSETLVEVHITTSMIIALNLLNQIKVEEQQIIRYTCKSNKCNNQLLTDSLVQIVNNYFILKPMEDALIRQTNFPNMNLSNHIAIEPSSIEWTHEEEEELTSSKSITIEDIKFNIGNKSFYISINLIFILLFILFDI